MDKFKKSIDLKKGASNDFAILLGLNAFKEVVGDVVNDEKAGKLNEAYKKGELQHNVSIDTQNFPQNHPDAETIKKLDELLASNEITPRDVKYSYGSFVSDAYKEYTYNGNKFINYMDQWFEVKPLTDNSIFAVGMRTTPTKTSDDFSKTEVYKYLNDNLDNEINVPKR